MFSVGSPGLLARAARLPMLVALGLVLGVTAAQAAEATLGEAVNQADSKYLDISPKGGLGDAQEIVVGGGEEQGLPPIGDEISEGPVRVTLTFEAGPAYEDEVPYVPVVKVFFDNPRTPRPKEGEEPAGDNAAPDAGEMQSDAGETLAGPSEVAKLEGNGAADPMVSVQIAELDASNPYPEVVVSFFTGGAHCCSETHVVSSNADGSVWRIVDVGELDGGPIVSVDLDGDGTYEFETRDNAFLYAFGCYACSETPLRVLGVVDGTLKDMSGEARFQPAHAAWLKTMILGVPDGEVNGFLAGYVAQKIRLGEGRQAWDLMLKYYDRDSDWGLTLCDQDPNERGECPGKTTKVTFPEALERMLNENGYKVGG